MRKLIAVIAAAMTFGLAACGASAPASTTAAPASTEAPAAETKAESTETRAEASADGFKFDKTVQITIPFKAGSNTDTQIRFIQQYLEKQLGVTAVIVNEGGASGTIGVTSYVEKANDGTEILFTLPTPLYKAIAGETDYTLEDLTPVAQLTSSPFYLAFKAEDCPFADGAAVIDYIKANPGEFTYANAGNGGIAHLALASFLAGEGLDALSVPYTGGTADCYTAVMGGEVMAYCVSQPDLVGRDDIKPLINLGSKSSAEGFADVPTLAELGYDGYVTDTFAGFYLMSSADPAIAAALDSAVNAMVNDADFQAACKESGFEVTYLGQSDFAAKIAATAEAAKPVLESITQ